MMSKPTIQFTLKQNETKKKNLVDPHKGNKVLKGFEAFERKKDDDGKTSTSKRKTIIPLCQNPWDKDKNMSKEDRDAASALMRELNGEDEDDDDENRVIELKGGKQSSSQLLAIVMNTRDKLGKDKDGNLLNDAERLKKDLNLRPDEEDVDGDEWRATPIEGFGKAMLRGMGWKGGKKNSSKHVQAVVRPGRLGLGATAKPWERRKNGGSSSTTTTKSHRKKGIVEGAHVGVISGPYEGDLGIVTDAIGSSFVVQLEHFGDKTQPKSFLLHIDSRDTFREFTENHPPPKGKKSGTAEKTTTTTKETKKRSREEEEEKVDVKNNKKRKKDKKRKKEKERYIAEVPRSNTKLWVRPHIRVRLIGRKCYRQKACVLEVLDPVRGDCNVRLEDSGKLLENIRQRDIETVLPKPGGEVIVLGGTRRGERAKLLEINKRREVATVQIHQDMSIVKVHLDDAAQYMLRDDWWMS